MAVEDELRVGVVPEQKPRIFADQVCLLILFLCEYLLDRSVRCLRVCPSTSTLECVFACSLCLSERFTGLPYYIQ